MLTISKVKALKGMHPYHIPLKCVIASALPPKTYTKDGVHKEMQQLVLCDNTGYLKANAFDTAKKDVLKEGATVILKNFISKPDAVIITSRTSVFKAPSLKVDQEIIDQAVVYLRPPTPPPADISIIKSSPVKTIHTVEGKIIQVIRILFRYPEKVLYRGEFYFLVHQIILLFVRVTKELLLGISYESSSCHMSLVYSSILHPNIHPQVRKCNYMLQKYSL